MVNICDVCGKEGKTPFHVTWNSGKEYDACSVKCLEDGESKK